MGVAGSNPVVRSEKPQVRRGSACGKASGAVSSTEDPAFTDCVASVPVKIQRKTKSGWKNAGSTTTSDTGSYSLKTKGKPGKYRALAPKTSLGDPVSGNCLKAKSATRTIK